MGNYELVSDPPDIISPIGVIEKTDGGVRLIYDCSVPKGKSVNDNSTEDWHQKFARVDDAAALVTEGCFMAKIDLQDRLFLPTFAGSLQVCPYFQTYSGVVGWCDGAG